MKIEDYHQETLCECGKSHTTCIKSIITGKGALLQLPQQAHALGITKAFLLADGNTDKLAGDSVRQLLRQQGIAYAQYTFPAPGPEPDEQAVGSVVMHYDTACNGVIAIGSGVINDLGKVIASITGVPYIIIGTAPSMDGYASATSSMARDGLKVTLPSKSPDVIIGDLDLLKTAPDEMLRAGLGDMLAKFVSICEWRIAHVVTGEYYCEKIAQLVRDSLAKCLNNVQGLLHRDDEAIMAVFDGLIVTGLAMGLVGVSRPASGIEHYFSHIWDMRVLSFELPTAPHGIQCAEGTLIACALYHKLLNITPDREKALHYAKNFCFDEWAKTLTELLGAGAAPMIAAEAKDGKYDPAKHKARLVQILEKWDEIQQIIRQELPTLEALSDILEQAGLSTQVDPSHKALLPTAFRATKDIRDKYVLSRLAWDLGIIDSLADGLLAD